MFVWLLLVLPWFSVRCLLFGWYLPSHGICRPGTCDPSPAQTRKRDDFTGFVGLAFVRPAVVEARKNWAIETMSVFKSFIVMCNNTSALYWLHEIQKCVLCIGVNATEHVAMQKNEVIWQTMSDIQPIRPNGISPEKWMMIPLDQDVFRLKTEDFDEVAVEEKITFRRLMPRGTWMIWMLIIDLIDLYDNWQLMLLLETNKYFWMYVINW